MSLELQAESELSSLYLRDFYKRIEMDNNHRKLSWHVKGELT